LIHPAILLGVIVYVINPGSTSTKLGLAEVMETKQGTVTAKIEKRELQHASISTNNRTETSLTGDGNFDPTALERLRRMVLEASRGWPKPDAIASRGGLIGPVEAGTYRITPALARHSLDSPYGTHAGNLGATLALEWAVFHNVPAFIVDPPTVDEMLPEARVTGVPGVERRSRFHALNARAVARRAALEVGKRLEEACVVVAHLGGGSSITTFHHGRAVDTSGALLDEGPFTPQRAGSLPTEGLLDLAYHTPRNLLERQLTQESGFLALTGTADLREIEAREADDATVQLAVSAFIHQIAKNVGAYAAAAVRPDAIAITGGAARWESLVERLSNRLGWIAPVIVIPGELELEALAEGAGRVLYGLEQPKEWEESRVTSESEVRSQGSEV
jgi:butyrate kinase